MYSRRMLIPFPRHELRSYPFHTPKKRPVQEAWDSVVDPSTVGFRLWALWILHRVF